MSALKACWLVLLTGAVWLALSALADAPRVTVAVEGSRYQYEPATVRLRVRVVQHPDNRALTVALVSDGFERSSLEQLEGAASPLVRWIDYRDVPAGEYAVVAEVVRTTGAAQARDRLTVLSRF